MYRYENLDELSAILRTHADKLGYVALYEKTRGRSGEEIPSRIGRYDVADSVSFEAAIVPPLDEQDEEGMSEDPEEGGEDDEARDEEPREPQEQKPRAARMLREVVAWVRQKAEGMMCDRQVGKFQVRLYQKSSTYLTATTFVIRVDESELERPGTTLTDSPPPPLPDVPPLKAAETAAGVVLNDLCMAYSQFLFRVMMPSVQQVTAMHMQVNTRLMSQNLRLEDRCKSLVEALTTRDTAIAQVEAEQSDEARRTAGRTATAQAALRELGALGRSFVFIKSGVPAEYHGLLEVISQHDDLAAALKDPTVVEMLKKPENVKTLTGLLRAAAEEHQKDQKEDSNAPGSEPEPEPPAA